ncbi:hypothetical protein LOAG_03136 [Loa loa]|uniref:Uncharacterized protein n=1 Tax=Loa loa TaxID=7209 RepID=A0A1S0U557_LOALO|nr:hypothetical protein LOAG_03136 [Loa loa]EFO25341.1 hypothetical protein LOAG_03136 [Loa loa]
MAAYLSICKSAASRRVKFKFFDPFYAIPYHAHHYSPSMRFILVTSIPEYALHPRNIHTAVQTTTIVACLYLSTTLSTRSVTFPIAVSLLAMLSAILFCNRSV